MPAGGPVTAPGGGAMGGPGGAAGGPGGAIGGPAIGAAGASGAPHAWQKAFPSGFWAPQRAHAIAIYVRDGAEAAGLRVRFTDDGAAVSAPPQFGQKPDATMCMWQLGHTVSANPMCAASSMSAWWSR
jgi:hypothetical protein